MAGKKAPTPNAGDSKLTGGTHFSDVASGEQQQPLKGVAAV